MFLNVSSNKVFESQQSYCKKPRWIILRATWQWTYMRDVEQSPDRSWTMDRRPNFLQSLLVTHASTPNLKITDLIQFRNLSILNLWLKLHILLQVFLLVMVFCACNVLLKSVVEGLCHFYLKRSIQWNLRQNFHLKFITHCYGV